jgi:hypothetical protein
MVAWSWRWTRAGALAAGLLGCGSVDLVPAPAADPAAQPATPAPDAAAPAQAGDAGTSTPPASATPPASSTPTDDDGDKGKPGKSPGGNGNGKGGKS